MGQDPPLAPHHPRFALPHIPTNWGYIIRLSHLINPKMLHFGKIYVTKLVCLIPDVPAISLKCLVAFIMQTVEGKGIASVRVFLNVCGYLDIYCGRLEVLSRFSVHIR